MSALDRLLAEGPVLIDGGLSTQLEAMGHDLDDPLWTARVLIERPEVVTAAHRAFHTAGAQVAITASYQVSREGFRAVGLTDADADAALRASVSAARQAGCEIVAASVGPYGAITHDGAEYRGRYGRSIDELASFHAERIAVLVDAGPDLLAVETIPDAEEMAAIAQVLQSHPDVPVWCAFTAADGATLCAGHAIEDAVRIATACPSVMAVGINCTGPEHVPELIVRIAATTRLPVIAYPNAGGTWDAASGTWTEPSTEIAEVGTWLEAGAHIVGGCCGTDAVAIATFAQGLSTR